jgi:SAM-dependent methyltransferase
MTRISETPKRFLAVGRRFHSRDMQLYDEWFTGTIFHASYWPRRRVRHLILSRAPMARGILLDVGCGMKPYVEMFAPYVDRQIGLDYSSTSGYRGNAADVFGDAAAIPFRTDSVDTVLSIAVLEHVEDPDRVVGEIARVVRPGGLIMMTTPFVFPVHATADYFRFSAAGTALLMGRHGIEVLEQPRLTAGGLTLVILFNILWFELGFMSTKWLYPIGIVLRPILLLLVALVNVVGWLVELLLPAPELALDHLTIGRKREGGVGRDAGSTGRPSVARSHP